MIFIKNILNINTNKTPYELGYANCGCDSNKITLDIQVDNITNPYLEFTLVNGTTVNTDVLEVNNNIISYEVPFSYYSTNGTLNMRVRGDNYNSNYIGFTISKNLTSTDNVIVKIENGKYLVKTMAPYKYHDLPIANADGRLGIVTIGDNLSIDSSGRLSSTGGGLAATVTVGTTTTGEAGTNASVTNSGTAQEAVLNFVIPRGANGTDGTNGTDGQDGTDGREVEIQVANSYIQWRYIGDATWNNLIAISELKGEKGDQGEQGIQGEKGETGNSGADGKEIKLQATDTYIQWKYDTDTNWTNLVPLSDLKGATGEQGIQGEQGEQGVQGEKGETGLTPDIQIGTTTTLEAGSSATVTKTGTAENPVLNFGIPKGDTALTVNVGTTTTGKEANVTNSGTNTDLVLDFVIPKQNSKEKVEGSELTITDANGSYSPITFKIEGKSEQNGTPTSTVPVEIKTVQGVNHILDIKTIGENLFDENNVNILNCYVNDNGVISLASARSIYIPIIGGETYTIQRSGSKRLRAITTSSLPSNGAPRIDIVSDDNASSITIATSNTAKYLVVYFYLTSDSNDKTIEETLATIQIKETSTTSIDMNKPNLLDTPYTSENKLTDTATKNDYYKSINYYATLEAGKKYKFSCETDGTWGHSTTEDTVEAYLLLNNAYTTVIALSTNPFTFTPTVSGNYYLRYDINSSGKTHSFWDFKIVEADIYYELASVNDIEDTLTIQDNKAIIDKKIGKISSYNGETITTEYISTTGGLSTGATVYYVLAESQTITLDKPYNIKLFDKTNNITTNDELQPNMSVEYWTDIKGNKGADGLGVEVLSSEDSSNPICLFDLDEGIYSLYGYVKYYSTYTGTTALTSPTLATVQKSSTTTYIQLLQPYGNKVIGYKITSNSYKSTEIEPIEDSGWIEATLTSDFKTYGNDSQYAPKYRKRGKIVEIRGAVSPTSELAASATKTIFTLPNGYRPSAHIYRLQQGSSKKSWLCQVGTGGGVSFQRYGTTATEKCPTTDWLPFQMEFMVD